MRRTIWTILIIIFLGGCASTADRLKVLERKEQNLAEELNQIEVEVARLNETFEILERIASLSRNPEDADIAKARREIVEPRVAAHWDEYQEAFDQLVEVRAKIADLVE